MTAPASPRVAVVGHVEEIQFVVVDRVPAAGEVVRATHWFTEAGGGGAIAAVQIRKLAGAATFLTALGSDGVADRLHAELERRGVTVRAALRPGPHRRGFVHLDGGGERTITIMGSRVAPSGDDPLAWADLEEHDAVYFSAGDAAAAAKARAARVLVATARAFDALVEADVQVDVLVASAVDRSERHDLARLRTPPRYVALTDGARGGTATGADGTAHRWDAVAPPGPVVDAFGCGDSFAAGLTFALGAGHGIRDALELGARCGAHCAAGRGAFAGQLERAP